MNALKTLIVIGLLWMMVPALAQDRVTDGYAYHGTLACEFKITLRVAETSHAISYRLTYPGAKTAAEGVVDPGQSLDLKLPRTRQWYDLTVTRDAADVSPYTISAGDGCANANAVLAPDPLITEAQLSGVWSKLTRVVHKMHGG